MSEKRLYAIVLRLGAMRHGAIPLEHGDQARAALFDLIKQGDSPLADKLHNENGVKPYTISLLQGGKRGKDGAHHFAEGDSADWRFSLLLEPAFEALLRKYFLNRNLPHLRIGALTFAVQDVFASGVGHRDSGHISIMELTERWNYPAETLPKRIVLDFRSPTAFNLGQDKETKKYHIRSNPDAKTIFSALRHRWTKLGGVDVGDIFDDWIGENLELEPIEVYTRKLRVENRLLTGFMGQVAFRLHGKDLTYLPYLHLLSDLAFWTGVGYQTTRGMGQVRRVSAN